MIVRLTILLLAFVCSQVEAETFCVSLNGSGNFSGADWNNQKPFGSFARGDGNTYYVASGDYRSLDDVFLNTAVSSTTRITIKKATALDHGTDTGWQSSYGTGQARFIRIIFDTGYWTFSGTSRTGLRSGHGFKVEQGTGADGLTVSAPDIIIEYVEGQGGGDDGPGHSPNNDAVTWRTTGAADNTIVRYNWFYDYGRCIFFCNQSISGVILEHNVTDRYESVVDDPETPEDDGEHAEIASIWGGANNWTIRYNLFNYCEGTGGLILDGANWFIYGNVFYRLTADEWENGNGVIGTWTASTMTGCKIYYNTFININSGQVFGTIYTAPTTGNEAKNNLFYNVSGGISYSLIATHDYNHYVDSGSTRSEANGTSGTGNPFVSLDALNFRLSSDTAAGVALGAPYDGDGVVDIYGNARTQTRGAASYQAAAPADTTHSYYTNVTAVNLILGP